MSPLFTKRLVVFAAFAFIAGSVFVRFGPVASAGPVPADVGAESGKSIKMNVDYRGTQDLVESLRGAQAVPTAISSIDLDGDAAPDVITGYAWNGTGIITVQRGNPDAFAPRDDSVFVRMQQGYNPSPLVSTADAYRVPVGVDLLQVGDFNHDNRKDVLAAKRGGDMYLFAGDGHGGLEAPERVDLSGTVTALTAGEFRAPDGWTDVAVAIDGPGGPEVLVYDGVEGFTGEPMAFRLKAPATGLQIASLDTDPFLDLAVAVGSEIDIVHGWGRKQTVDPEARIQRIDLGYNARDLATGLFVWNRTGDSEIAVLSVDGTIHIVAPGGMDERPFTDAEMQMHSRSRGHLVKQNIDIESARSWQPAATTAWREVRAVDAAKTTSGKVFQRSRISFGVTDDIVTSDAEGQGIVAVRQSGEADRKQSGANDLKTETIDAEDAPVAFLALPQKLNGERDLITVHAGSVSPIMIPQAPTAGISVDRFDDPNGGALAAASVCGAGANDCSLRGAVQFANANAGTTINIPAGTVVLATSGVGGNGGCTSGGETNANGDLEINTTTTLIGAGQASTIIRQAAATNDRVFCLDVPLAGSTYNFSAMTITGGRDQGINGGAGLLGGAKNGTTNFTNITFVNNQTSNASFGGGGATVTGGSMTVTNCTFGAANLPGTPANRNDLTVGNAAFTSGGGLAYTSGDPAGTNGATGTLTMTGTTFTHNTSASGCCGGGGLDVFGLNVSTPTVNISTTTFTSNQAINTASGGGMNNEAANVTVATTSFTSNSALNRGGGIYVGGGSLTLDGTSPSLTFTSNTATSGGSSIATASTVNMLGTNTTIGGSIQVEAGGIWNNSTATLAPTDIVIAGGTFNCNASTMNVAGNLTLGPSGNGIFGGTFNGNSGTVNLAGNLTTNTGGTTPVPSFNGNTGTINFNGSGAQSSGGTLSPTFNNLTVNKTNTLTLGVNSAVTGNLTVTAGTFDLGVFTVNRSAAGGTLTVSNGTTLKVGGTNPLPTNYSTHSVGATSTIEYSGGSQTVSTLNSSQNYGNLTISGSGTKTLAGATTVVGNLLISGTLDVSASNFALNVAGDYTNNVGPASFNPRAGTLTFNGSGAQNLNGLASSQSFNNFTVNKSGGTLTVGGSTTSLSMSGAVTLTAGTFAAGTATAIQLSAGDWTNNGGTFTPGASIVNFTNIAGAQTINGTASSQTFTSINVAKGAQTLSVAGSTATLTLNGTMSLNTGTFAAGTATNINVGASWINNGGTFTPGAGTVTFNGAVGQNLTGSAATQTFNNFVVNKSGGTLTGVASTTTLNVNNMTLTAGAFSAGSLTAINPTGDWTNNGGTFTPGSSVVSFTNTAAAQNINGTATTQTFNSITMAKTAQTLNVGGSTSTLNLNGTMLLTSGTLATGGVAINIGGNWTNNGGLFSSPSPVNFNGSSPQLINGTASTQNFTGNLSVSSSSTLSAGGSMTTIGVGGLAMVSGTFNTPAVLNVNGGVTSSGGTIVAGSSINLSGAAATYDFRNCTFTAGSGTVSVTGTGAQSLKIANGGSLNNLTINTTGSVTATGSPFIVNGLFMITSGTFFVGGNTLDVNGNARFIGTLDAATGGSNITAAGDWDNTGGGIFNPGANTVTFDGAGAQSIKGDPETFNNFTVNKSGGTLTGTGSVTALTLNGAMTLTAGTFAPGTITSFGVAGNWTNNGATFTPGIGTVTFNGSALQTIGGTSSTSFNGLTLNNVAGAALGINTTVNGGLTLTNGELGTGAFTLSLGSGATASRTNGFVVGTVQKSFGGVGSITLPLGTAGMYSPLDVTVTAGAGSLTAKANTGVAPLAPVGLDSSKTLHRFWTLSGTGITSNITFHYIDPTDVFGTEANYQVTRVAGGTTLTRFPNSATIFVTPASDSFTVMGLSVYSDWTAGEPVAPTAANVEVSGRVVTQKGLGIAGARVSMTDSHGDAVNVMTNAFGYYRFANVTAGQDYVMAVTHKRFSFATRLINVTDSLADLDFVAEP